MLGCREKPRCLIFVLVLLHHELQVENEETIEALSARNKKGAVGVYPTALFIFAFTNTFVTRAPSALVLRAAFLAAVACCRSWLPKLAAFRTAL
jgi:hypothetical protein